MPEPKTLTQDELATMIGEATGKAIAEQITAATDGLSKRFDEQLAELKKPADKDADAPVITNVKDKVDDDPTGGFAHIADFAMAIVRSGPGRPVDPRLTRAYRAAETENKAFAKAAGTGMEEGTDIYGGFLIPTEFRAELLRNALEASLILSRARMIPVGANRVQIPAVNETSRASNVYGGVTVYWPGELGVKTESKPALAQVELSLKKVIGMAYVSDELLQDSPITLQPLLRDMFSEAIAYEIDEQLINGVGAGRPLGILHAPCLISEAKEAAQVADTIVTENILKMMTRMNGASFGNAVWFAHQNIRPQLAVMSMDVSTAGGTLVYLPAGGLSGAMFDSLMGRPVVYTEHCQTLGDKGDIIFADMRQYLVAQKSSSPTFDMSIHLKFDYDQVAFRLVSRIDGQPWWISALTPKHGSTTVSPFVTLDERA